MAVIAKFSLDRKVIFMHDKEIERFKLEIYVPESHMDALQSTLQSAGAGRIGKYDSCLSYSRVRSTWRPLVGAKPYNGFEGIATTEDELKVEVIVLKSKLAETLQAIRSVHPYEEPVINVIPLYGG